MNIKNFMGFCCLKTVFLFFLIFPNNILAKINKNLIVIGHRGARAYAPENTVTSIKKALEFGVSMIEFDVHQCATGELVVIHDFTVDKTTNGTGVVANMTLTELQSLTIKNDEHIPTLQEVLNAIHKKAVAVIELKGQKTVEPTAKIITDYVTKKEWSYDDFLIVSFDHIQLKKMKQLLPEIPVATTHYGLPVEPVTYAQSVGAKVLSLHPAFVSSELVQKAHANNISIFIWHHGIEADSWAIRQALEMGVDGIFADAPDKLFLED